MEKRLVWNLQVYEIKWEKFPIFRAAIKSNIFFIDRTSETIADSSHDREIWMLISAIRQRNNRGVHNTSGFHRSYEEKCERSSIPSVRPPNERSDPAANWLKTILPTVIIIPRRGTKGRGSRSQRCTRFNRRAWIWNLMCPLSISTWNHDLYINRG